MKTFSYLPGMFEKLYFRIYKQNFTSMIPDPGLLQPILQPWINILVDRLTGRQVRQLDNR